MRQPRTRDTIMTAQYELTELELDTVSGGNFFLDVLGTVLGNAIYDAATSNGPVKGGVLDFVVKNIVPH
jgi:hypothetical protein